MPSSRLNAEEQGSSDAVMHVVHHPECRWTSANICTDVQAIPSFCSARASKQSWLNWYSCPHHSRPQTQSHMACPCSKTGCMSKQHICFHRFSFRHKAGRLWLTMICSYITCLVIGASSRWTKCCHCQRHSKLWHHTCFLLLEPPAAHQWNAWGSGCG